MGVKVFHPISAVDKRIILAQGYIFRFVPEAEVKEVTVGWDAELFG